MFIDATTLCAAYETLLELSVATLRCSRERDWEAFAALREREAEILVQLRAADAPRMANGAIRGRLEQMISAILANQHEATALLAPWRDEIAAQLRSAGSSRKLVKAYSP
jgi:hypothetical protein